MDATAAARAWVAGSSRVWPSGDTDAVAASYAEGASFFSHPFRGHQEPRDYAAWAFAEQLSAVCRFGPPSSRATGRRSTGGR